MWPTNDDFGYITLIAINKYFLDQSEKTNLPVGVWISYENFR